MFLRGSPPINTPQPRKEEWKERSRPLIERETGKRSHSYRNPRHATAAQIKRRAKKRRNQLRHKAHQRRRG